MKKALLLAILYSVMLSATAQNKEIDSLTFLLENYPKEDTNQVVLLGELAEAYLKNEQYIQGLLANQKLQTLSKKLNYHKGKGLYLQNLALFHLNNQMFLNYQWQAIDVFEAIGDKKAIKTKLSILNFNTYPTIKGLKIDSLKNALSFFEKRQDKAIQADILQVMAVESFHQNQLEKAIEYGTKALLRYEILANAQGVVCASFYLIYSFEKQGRKPQVVETELALAKFIDKIEDKKDLAFSLFLIGSFYANQKRYDLSLDYLSKCIKNIGENNEVLLTYALNSVSLILDGNTSDYSSSQLNEYRELNLKAIEKVKNDSRVELFLIIIPIESYRFLYEEGKVDEAMSYLSEAKDLAEKSNNNFGLSHFYDVLGQTRQKQGKYQEAIPYFLQAVDYSQKAGEWWAVAYQNLHIARCYQSLGKLSESLKYGQKAYQLAVKNGLGDVQMNTARLIAQIYGELRQYQQANTYYKIYVTFQDSISHQDIERKFTDIEIQNTIQKSKQEIALLEKDKQIQFEENKNQRLWLFSASGAFLFTILLAFVLYHNNRNKQKINKLLQSKNDEIATQAQELQQSNEALNYAFHQIEKKNEDITASINAALRIQSAMLPAPARFDKALGQDNYFVFYKPRDIVSGDFYFLEEISDKVILVCADCTGHGVPGAFMSMIGNQALTEIVGKRRNIEPDKILNLLNKEINQVLKQNETHGSEGMDVAVITIDKGKNLVKYAGAMNPIYYVVSDFPNQALSNSDLESQATLQEIKADKKPIGGIQEEEERIFNKHEIQLGMRNEESGMKITTNNQQPTVIYLFSDGFQDQFGGAQGKKFMVKRFRELLFSIHHLPMHEQRQILDNTIEQWMAEGKEHQIDDILVMGVRV
jgi:serine phosphatase RsbU (regulator of sigma subunit)